MEVSMKASIVDLRYKSAEILKALERNEDVTVMYHGKVKGVITPVRQDKELKVREHPFFGMHAEVSVQSELSVEELMDRLRSNRHAL